MRIRTNFAGFDLPARHLSPRKDSERRATKRKFVSDFVRGALCFVRTAPCCPRRPCCSHAVPVMSMPSLLCPCRPPLYQSRLPFRPNRPPFSVKTTTNRAPKRYFYAPFAPNEKNFVYLHSLSGRISTSFIGCRAVAQEGRDGSGGPKPRTQDYGSGYPYGKPGTAGMLGAKHNNCCNNEQRRNHQARKRADVGKDGCRCSVVQGR